MKYILTSSEGAKQALVQLLLDKEWLLCCTSPNPDDLRTYVIENVCRYDIEGYWASNIFHRPVYIEYGISRSSVNGSYPYRIHDSLMQPIVNGKNFIDIVEAMLSTFDVIIIEEGLIDRKHVFGKLGGGHSEEIVFFNE